MAAMAAMAARSFTPKLCNVDGCKIQITGSKDICEGCRTKKLWIDMYKRSQVRTKSPEEESDEADRQEIAEILRKEYPDDSWGETAEKIKEFEKFEVERKREQAHRQSPKGQVVNPKQKTKIKPKNEKISDDYFIPIDTNNKKRFDLPTFKPKRQSPFLTKGLVDNDGASSHNPRSSSAPTIGYKNNDDDIFQMDMGGRKSRSKKSLFKKKRKKRKTRRGCGGKSPKRRWSRKYKLSINCKKPKGFSQKQYCKGRLKRKTKRGYGGKSPRKSKKRRRTKKRRRR